MTANLDEFTRWVDSLTRPAPEDTLTGILRKAEAEGQRVEVEVSTGRVLYGVPAVQPDGWVLLHPPAPIRGLPAQEPWAVRMTMIATVASLKNR